MPAKKPCIRCKDEYFPMHMKKGVCRPCQEVATNILSDALLAIQADTEQACHEEMREYGGEELSAKTLERLKAIPACKTAEEADALARETIQWSQIHFLSEWAKGRIRGKVTPERLEKEAKEADNLAAFLTKKGLTAQAEQQRGRAATLRSELKSMRRTQ